METTGRPEWAHILRTAVNEPGTVNRAYSAFHTYSLGNQMLALMQCSARDIQPGPIATYKHWQTLGRQVRKGEKAMALWMPITGKRTSDDGDSTNEIEERTFVRFMFASRWFVLSQTDGEAVEMSAAPAWDRTTALAALDVTEVPFAHTNGNVQGYARPERRELAVSPIASDPLKTTIHELAHILLHAADDLATDSAELPRNLREVEAEGTALLVFDALGYDTTDSRGYIQHWYGSGQEIPSANAGRIMKAADQILKAGAV